MFTNSMSNENSNTLANVSKPTTYVDQITALLDEFDSKYSSTKASEPSSIKKIELSNSEKELLSKARAIRYETYLRKFPISCSQQISFLLDWHYSAKGLITENEFISIDKQLSDLEEQIFTQIKAIENSLELNLPISEEQMYFFLNLIEKEGQLPPIYQNLEI